MVKEKILAILVIVQIVVTAGLLLKVNAVQDILATHTGLVAKDIKLPGFANSGDDPMKGDKDAPVTIVEFSDFQCPYCGKFFTDTLPLIQKNYIDTGKAKLVFQDYPLSFHQFAHKAAEAAECADEQGAFWKYHDKIFQNQQSLNLDNLKVWASDLGLNTKKFNTCLDSGAMVSEVQGDMAEGTNLGVSGTPAFLVNGQLITGAQPFEAFKQIIDAELAK